MGANGGTVHTHTLERRPSRSRDYGELRTKRRDGKQQRPTLSLRPLTCDPSASDRSDGFMKPASRAMISWIESIRVDISPRLRFLDRRTRQTSCCRLLPGLQLLGLRYSKIVHIDSASRKFAAPTRRAECLLAAVSELAATWSGLSNGGALQHRHRPRPRPCSGVSFRTVRSCW